MVYFHKGMVADVDSHLIGITAGVNLVGGGVSVSRSHVVLLMNWGGKCCSTYREGLILAGC